MVVERAADHREADRSRARRSGEMRIEVPPDRCDPVLLGSQVEPAQIFWQYRVHAQTLVKTVIKTRQEGEAVDQVAECPRVEILGIDARNEAARWRRRKRGGGGGGGGLILYTKRHREWNG